MKTENGISTYCRDDLNLEARRILYRERDNQQLEGKISGVDWKLRIGNGTYVLHAIGVVRGRTIESTIAL